MLADMDEPARRDVPRFVAFTFVATWLLWAPLVILGERVPQPVTAALTMAGSMIPSAVAILLLSVTGDRGGRRSLRTRLLSARVGPGWYAAVLLLPLLVPVAVAISVLVGGEAPDVDVTALGVIVLFVLSIFPGSALGEELGWRGFLLPRLLAHRGALTASLTLGALWGLWHLPLWLVGDDSRPVSVFPVFLVSAAAISVVMTWMHKGTGGSLLVIVLYHAAANLPLTLFIAPLGSAMLAPFSIYAVLIAAAAVGIVIADGATVWTRPSGHPTSTGAADAATGAPGLDPLCKQLTPHEGGVHS